MNLKNITVSEKARHKEGCMLDIYYMKFLQKIKPERQKADQRLPGTGVGVRIDCRHAGTFWGDIVGSELQL